MIHPATGIGAFLLLLAVVIGVAVGTVSAGVLLFAAIGLVLVAVGVIGRALTSR